MDEFDDDEFDESTIRQLDEIESTLLGGGGEGSSNMAADERHPLTVPSNGRTHAPVASSRGPPPLFRSQSDSKRLEGSSIIDVSSDLDDEELMQHASEVEKRFLPSAPRSVDVSAKRSRQTFGASSKRVLSFEKAQTANTSASDIATSTFKSTPSLRRRSSAATGPSRQLTLFGETLPPQGSQGIFLQANKANSAIGPASQQARQAIASILAPTQESVSGSASTQRGKTKQWDFAQPIVRPKKAFKADPDGFDEYDDDALDDVLGTDEFELPPAPVEPEVHGLQQMKVRIDREAAKTWVYPTNKEKRDYQFNIVQRALFNNVLVALPTGLGKTFIAAVVILNYYRWFPQGKIIFVAPTKPLVAQQQMACHGICGLPWDTAIEMTGETRASLRAEEWKAKQIFYMTPQTFENDLCSTAIDAEDVVCVVVDEAHRATGNYAYGKVVRHLMTRNPFFRVLALTATPGSNSDKVQEVVDSLHINLIEIRQEDALDIRKYVHAKDEDPVVVPLTGVVAELRDLLARLMKPHMDILIGAGVLQARDPVSLAPFAVRSIYRDPRKKDVVQRRKLYNHIKDLGTLAQAMECLVKYSVSMFASRMWSLETGVNDQGKKASTARQQTKYQVNTVVRDMRKLYEECQDEEGFVPHPKMDYLQNVIAAHFANAEDDEGEAKRDTRVMVFCSLRECVTEIVTLLNRVTSVKATQFVGQSTDSKGNRGLRQKEQERIVADFKRGEFNVLVATSIGEEGLDIGEVDLIVCYEAVKNAVRMLQRVGRTGRKREGRIVVLMSEGPEEKNWQQSKDQYKTIQHDIIKGINLSLYDDVERLVPADITSEVLLKDVDQPPFEPSMICNATKSKKAPSEKKRKRNTDPLRNVPEEALTGFVKVSEMRKAKGKGKGKGKHRKTDFREGDDESTEEESLGSSAARMEHPPALDSLSEDSEAELERGLVWQPRIASMREQEEVSPAQHDSSDTSINLRARGRSLGTRRPRPANGRSTSDSLPVIALSSSQRGNSPGSPSQVRIRDLLTDIPRNSLSGRERNDEARIVDDAVVEIDVHKTGPTSSSSSPIVRRRAAPHPSVARLAAEMAKDSEAEDDDEGMPETKFLAEESPIVARQRKRTFVRRIEPVPSSSPSNTNHRAMGPPAAPSTSKRNGATVAKVDHPAKKVKVNENKGRKARKRIGPSPTSRRLFQVEAERSTDEERHGDRDEHDEGDSRYEEDSSDLEHVGDFVPTQAPKGYGQQAVYLQSLNTQTDILPFRKAPPSDHIRVAATNGNRSSRMATSSTYGHEDESDNEYELGSFVCSDEEIVFDSSAEGDLSIRSSL